MTGRIWKGDLMSGGCCWKGLQSSRFRLLIAFLYISKKLMLSPLYFQKSAFNLKEKKKVCDWDQHFSLFNLK